MHLAFFLGSRWYKLSITLGTFCRICDIMTMVTTRHFATCCRFINFESIVHLQVTAAPFIDSEI